MNPRTCIATREEKPVDEMIRFVLDGNDTIVPDIKRNLPGRGVWLTNGRSFVRTAIEKSLFERGFKKPLARDTDLVERVDEVMSNSAKGLLSLSRKAGVLVPGRNNVEKTLLDGKAAMIINATDANPDSKQRIQSLVKRTEPSIEVFELFESEELDGICGVANTMHLAIVKSGIAEKAKDMMEKLRAYRSL